MMIIVMIVLVLGANFYVFLRLWQMMPPTLAGRVVLIAGAVVALLSFFLSFVLMRSSGAPEALTALVYKIGTAWLMIMLYFVLLFAVVDILRLVRVIPSEAIRHSWAAFSSVVGLIALIMTAGHIHYRNKSRTEIDITTEKPLARPVKLVAISDMHLGYGIDKQEFRKWVELINAEKPDAVIIAGDIIDTSLRPLQEQGMAEVFGEFTAPLGVFAVPGNHEYISDISQSVEFLREAGVKVLMDETVLVDSLFYIAGRDDRTNTDRKPLAGLVEGLRDKPVVLLDHQPYHLEEAEECGIDLQFSGHTHRGQVWPISLITDMIYEDSYGYIRKGRSHIYVSSGLGIWGGKFRIGSRSEYVVINLSSADQ